MAYLTKSNLGQLCQKLEIKVELSSQFFCDHIYPDIELYNILNKIEREYLFVYKMLLDDEDKFVNEYYKEVPEKPDSKTFVFNKGGKMKYHLSLSCKMLKKDYLDFNIPIDIKNLNDADKNDTKINEYRDWFRSNSFADRYKNGEIDKNFIISQFNLKYPSKYNIEPIKENSNLLVVEAKNSSSKFLAETLDVDNLKKQLEDLKLKFQEAFPCKVSKTFSKFKHLQTKSDEEVIEKMTQIFSPDFVKNYGMKKLREKFEESKNLTFKITTLLLEYIKWTFDFNNKSFNVVTLEKFGLECCYACKDDDILQKSLN